MDHLINYDTNEHLKFIVIQPAISIRSYNFHGETHVNKIVNRYMQLVIPTIVRF